MSLNAIFAKFEKQFDRGPHRSGYLTPADADRMVEQGVADYMGPNTRKWVETSMANGSNESRWTTLKLTPVGLKREPSKKV